MEVSDNHLQRLEPFHFELHDKQSWQNYMLDNWSVVVVASLIYLFLVHFGRIWMAPKEPWVLRNSLILWNMFLSLGSWICFFRVAPELISEIMHKGITYSLCNNNERTIVWSFWCTVFELSKLIEFGDTAFIILRKQPLLFLHWYHHITVALYCFYAGSTNDPTNRWFACVNSLIHGIMYGYYVAKALKIKVPRRLAMTITSLQIFQMIIGVAVNVLSLWEMHSGSDCHRPKENIFWALAMYASYFYLFIQFFKDAYGPSKKNK